MTTTRRTYTREFTLMVVRQVARGEKRAAQVCREYDLASSVYDRWRLEYARKGEQAFQEHIPATELSHEQRMAELERFCGQLALENDLLKSAMLLRSTTANEQGYTWRGRSQRQDEHNA